MLQASDPLDVTSLRRRYAAGSLRPAQTVAGILERIERRGDDKVWIHRLPRAELEARAAALESRGPDGLPLYGIPFAIKDNIDCAGHPTTAACPEFAYTRQGKRARCVEALLAGGRDPGRQDQPRPVRHRPGRRALALRRAGQQLRPALPAGRLELGLGGRGGGGPRELQPRHRHRRLRPRAGRVQQPGRAEADARALLSTRGVVPACRSLDCVSIFALTAADAATVLRSARGFDAADPFSRRAAPAARAMPRSFAGCRFGVPRADQLQFFGNRETPELFAEIRRKP